MKKRFTQFLIESISPHSHGGELLGAGVSAGAYTNQTDPHTILRKTHFKTPKQHRDDPSYSYLKYVKDNELADNNIHFPRIYSSGVSKYPIHDRKDNNIKDIRLVLEIEKLIPIRALSLREARGIVEHLVTDEILHHYTTLRVNRALAIWDDVDSIFVLLCRHIETALTRNELDQFKSNEFIEACKILQSIKNKIGAKYDLHLSNIMARRTPHGIQIVFTDPFQ